MGGISSGTLRELFVSFTLLLNVFSVGRDVDYPLRPARSNQEVRATIAVGDPNAIAPRKKKLSQRRSHEDRSMGVGLLEPRRKGSCDSLASQKSADSSGLPVKDTLSKAKKQLQALLSEYIILVVSYLYGTAEKENISFSMIIPFNRF